MTRRFFYDGTELNSDVRLRFNLGQTAYRGEVGTGELHVDDPSGTVVFDAFKEVYITDDDIPGADQRIFTGWTSQRAIKRDYSLKVGNQRSWDVTLEDLNSMLGDRLLEGGDNAKRPAETDYQRINWLLGTGKLRQGGTNVAKGHVPNLRTRNMGEEDYRGRTPLEVLEDCSQRTGKNYYLYWDHNKGISLWYDKQGQGDLCAISISDDPADLGEAVLPPQTLDVYISPERQYHRVRLSYKGGVVAGNQDSVPWPRRRDRHLTNKRIKTRSRARDHVNNVLEQVEDEAINLIVHLEVSADQLAAIKPGMRIKVRLRHAGFNWVHFRIANTQTMPASTTKDKYRIRLRMADKIRPTHVDFYGDHYSRNTGGDERPPGGIPEPADETGGGAIEWTMYDDFECVEYKDPDSAVIVPVDGEPLSVPYSTGDIVIVANGIWRDQGTYVGQHGLEGAALSLSGGVTFSGWRRMTTEVYLVQEGVPLTWKLNGSQPFSELCLVTVVPGPFADLSMWTEGGGAIGYRDHVPVDAVNNVNMAGHTFTVWASAWTYPGDDGGGVYPYPGPGPAITAAPPGYTLKVAGSDDYFSCALALGPTGAPYPVPATQFAIEAESSSHSDHFAKKE